MIEDNCYCLVVYIRLSIRCKIFFFTLKSLSLSFPLKLTDLWITSLLFDLNYNLLMGASLLALAKSIYYIYNEETIYGDIILIA